MIEDEADSQDVSSAVMSQFQSIMDKQQLALFHREDYETSLCGFIVDFNSEFILVQRIDEQFEFGGYVVALIEEITLVQWGTNLLSRVEVLVAKRREKYPESPNLFLESWTTILNGLSDAGHSITVHRDEVSDGFLVSDQYQVIDELIILESINEEGQRDGQCMLATDSVSQVVYLDPYTQNLADLADLS